MSDFAGNGTNIDEMEGKRIDIDLSITLSIFGYRLNPKGDIPIERDNNGILEIQQNGKNTVDIIINTKFGTFSFYNINVEKESINNEAIESRYEIESNGDGFFMEFHVMTYCMRINLAFYQGGYQYSYDGVIERDTKSAMLVQSFKTNLSENQINNVQIYKREETEQVVLETLSGPPPVYIDTYGIVHECVDFLNNEISEVLWDDYWDPYTSIEYGIYRFQPTEAQVKSDLQTYNQDFGRIIPPYFHNNDILAYHIDSVEGPEWRMYETIGEYQYPIGIIYPYEIEGLWSTVYVGDGYLTIYPKKMLLMAAICYGYYEPPSTNPTMAKAFVDYGAYAFVGPTITIPGGIDTSMDIFWGGLSEYNEQVGTATEDMCVDFGWTYGTDWKIYGNLQTTLPD
ncbi:MAG: hypothetical protein ACFFDB_18630 [Promethearchaeota archaeon]